MRSEELCHRDPLYIADRRDEIEFRVWTTRLTQAILNRGIDEQQQLGVTKLHLELDDTKKFENALQEIIQELKLELKDYNNLLECEI